MWRKGGNEMEKQEAAREVSAWEKSLQGRGDGQMENKVLGGLKLERQGGEGERVGNSKQNGEEREKRQRQRKKQKCSRWWGARAWLWGKWHWSVNNQWRIGTEGPVCWQEWSQAALHHLCVRSANFQKALSISSSSGFVPLTTSFCPMAVMLCL